jgi:hypothetical protein
MVTDANNLLRLATEQRDDSIQALMGVLNALKGIDAPKSLLLVSEGLPCFRMKPIWLPASGARDPGGNRTHQHLRDATRSARV